MRFPMLGVWTRTTAGQYYSGERGNHVRDNRIFDQSRYRRGLWIPDAWAHRTYAGATSPLRTKYSRPTNSSLFRHCSFILARPGLLGALPGVAIAAALVPPIATTGIALSIGAITEAIMAATLLAPTLSPSF